MQGVLKISGQRFPFLGVYFLGFLDEHKFDGRHHGKLFGVCNHGAHGHIAAINHGLVKVAELFRDDIVFKIVGDDVDIVVLFASEEVNRFVNMGLKAFIDHQKRKAAMKAADKDEPIKGEQSVKELIGQGQGVSSMPIGDDGIKDFKKICNKYGVDFAVVKDKTVEPPQFTVFFKAKDADAITQVLKEYSAKQMKKKQKAETKKPSILDKLKKFKDIVAKTPRKDKEKKKEQTR